MGWEQRLKELDNRAQLEANAKLEKILRKILGKYFSEDEPVGKFVCTDADVRYIRMAYKAGVTQTKLASVLGVSRRTIGRILKRTVN